MHHALAFQLQALAFSALGYGFCPTVLGFGEALGLTGIKRMKFQRYETLASTLGATAVDRPGLHYFAAYPIERAGL